MNAPLTNVEIAAANTTANLIWQAAYERIYEAVRGFTTYRRTPALTIQGDDLPCLSVYLLRDREQPLGDSNVAEPRFKQFAHLGISGMIKASDVDQQLALLSLKIMATRLALYTDSKFVSLISGFESSDTKLVFARVNELPVAEYQMELVVSFETYWPPAVYDDFLRVHLITEFPTHERAPSTQQIRADWEFDADGNLIKPDPHTLEPPPWPFNSTG